MKLFPFSPSRRLAAGLAIVAVALAASSCTKNPPGPTIVETEPIAPEAVNATAKAYTDYRTLVWSDEFNGSSLDPKKWVPEVKDVWYNNRSEERRVGKEC